MRSGDLLKRRQIGAVADDVQFHPLREPIERGEHVLNALALNHPGDDQDSWWLRPIRRPGRLEVNSVRDHGGPDLVVVLGHQGLQPLTRAHHP